MERRKKMSGRLNGDETKGNGYWNRERAERRWPVQKLLVLVDGRKQKGHGRKRKGKGQKQQGYVMVLMGNCQKAE
jgi:hypothetical protein